MRRTARWSCSAEPAAAPPLGDTWVWDGTNWTEKTPVNSPSAREGATMAYDAAHGQVVLFGGDDAAGYLNDTWVWDGTNWTEETPTASPSGRDFSVTAYDAAHGQVVLFGGDDAAGYLNDTWVWDGTNWTQETPATTPSARVAFSMAYDAALGKVVLFGGYDGNNYLADTWVWDGSNWTQESPAASPSPRVFPAAAYDAAQGQVVLFGGDDYSGYVNDTWEYGQGDFRSISVGTTSAVQTLNFSIPASTTVGSIGVLTQGAPNLDFIDAGSDTCTATTYASTTNCTVNVQFAPKYAGLRMGAVVFKDGSGNVLSTTYISGIGTGPQIAFEPATITTLCGFNNPSGAAVDASGNVYVADSYNNAVKEMPSGCASSTCVSTLGTGFSDPLGVAVDASGNVYVGDSGNNAVKEMPPGCASSSCVTTLGGGFSAPAGVAVGGSGDVYVADYGSNAVKEMPAGCASSSCVTTLGGSFDAPYGVAVDGGGNVYVADEGYDLVKETPPGCASSSCVTALGSGFYFPTGVSVDGAGNVYVADYGNHAVKEMPPGCNSSSCVTPLGSGSKSPAGVAVDGGGNVYVADTTQTTLKKLNAATPPTLTFPTATAVGSTDTTDGTLTAQVFNIGNMPLVFSGFTYPTDFVEASDTNPCTSTTSLSAGQECDVPVEFAPLAPGSPLSENVTLTNNNLNGTNVQQSVPLSGTAELPAAATMISPSPDTALTSATTTFTWNAGLAGTTAYYLWIGTTPGGYDLANMGPFTGTSATVTLPTNGAPIYVRLWTFFNGGATQLYSDSTYSEFVPTAAAITSPSNGSTLASASTTFILSHPADVTSYYLWIGTTFGGYDLVNMGPFTSTKISVNLPTNGTPIYVRLWTFINGGATQLWNDYTFTEATSSAAAITSPSNGSTLLSASTTFNWSAGSGGALTYYLWVGTSLGAADLVNIGPLSTTSATVTLPTNGTPIYVRLWTFINGGAAQLSNDYTFTEATPAAAVITSPTNGSTLLSASTTFNWSAGSGGALTYYLWVGTSLGAADLVNIGPLSTTSATVNLPTSGTPVYVRLWTFINGGATQLSNDYSYTEATPAAAVITSPTNNSTLPGASTTFNWNPGSGGALTYYLWVGTSPGTADVANIGPISGTSTTVTLPTNGVAIYVRLWTFINGGATQLSNDYAYTEAGP